MELKNLVKTLPVVLPILFGACTSEKGPEPVDCNVNPVEVQNISTTESTCGVDNGSITVTATGGSGDYQYSIDGDNFQSSNTFTDLVAGNYNIEVKDVNDCSTSVSATVESNVDMTINTSIITEAGCGTEQGVLNVSIEGGESPYQYKIEGGSYQDEADLTGLAAGSLTVFARDVNGCEVSAMVEMTTGTSLEDDVMPLLETNCAISGCHDGNGSLISWADKTNVINNATNIKTRTGNGTMPPGDRSITDEEIQTIACWVDDGANDN